MPGPCHLLWLPAVAALLISIITGGTSLQARHPWTDRERVRLDHFIELSATHAVVSWYSSHEKDEQGQTITAIYLADLWIAE